MTIDLTYLQSRDGARRVFAVPGIGDREGWKTVALDPASGGKW